MEELLKFILSYGYEIVGIALATIFLIGCVKVFGLKKAKGISSGNKKIIYQLLIAVFSFGLTAAWLALAMPLFKLEGYIFTWEGVLNKGTISMAAVQVMYPVYENLRIRDLVQLVGKLIVYIFRGNKKAKAVIEQASATAEVVDKDKTIVL